MENDLSKAEHSAKNPKQANHKRQQVMSKWLGTPMKFRDPARAAVTSEAVNSENQGAVKL